MTIDKGITIVEVLLVVSITIILASVVSPFMISFVLKNSFDNSVDKTIATIRKAQEYNMGGKADLDWGVCISSQTLKLYGGTSCSSNTIEESFTIPSTITISGISDTKFTNRGEPNPANGLSSVSVTSGSETVTVSVNGSGGMDITNE